MGLSGWDGREDLNRSISIDQPIDIRRGDFRRGSSNLESRLCLLVTLTASLAIPADPYRGVERSS